LRTREPRTAPRVPIHGLGSSREGLEKGGRACHARALGLTCLESQRLSLRTVSFFFIFIIFTPKPERKRTDV
jgi:hypothetical protein